jgi:ABC-type Fe3+-hydroxamate transport system substrate-binding protein
MSKLFKGLIIISLFSLFISGCATIVSGTTQPIHLQAIDSKTHALIPGAMCTLTDKEGRTYVFNSNPGMVIVTKGQGALIAHCQKPGYVQSQVGVGQSFNAWTVANVILFWPGIFVDALSGAIQKYPSHITVLMEPYKKYH